MQLYIMMSILIRLLQNDIIKAKDLASEFEVSERSIYRYINSLSGCGVPVCTLAGRNGGIFLNGRFDLKSLYFTKEELTLLQKLLKADTHKNTELVCKIDYLIQNYA